jgi:hypothetical protein
MQQPYGHLRLHRGLQLVRDGARMQRREVGDLGRAFVALSLVLVVSATRVSTARAA